MRKVMLVILPLAIVGVTFFLLLSLFWLAHGSLELCPTPEEQEKARAAAFLVAAGLTLTDVFLAAAWAAWRREERGIERTSSARGREEKRGVSAFGAK